MALDQRIPDPSALHQHASMRLPSFSLSSARESNPMDNSKRPVVVAYSCLASCAHLVLAARRAMCSRRFVALKAYIIAAKRTREIHAQGYLGDNSPFDAL